MTKITPYMDQITVARMQAERHLDRLQNAEHLYRLVPLGQRLLRYARLLERNDLYLAITTDPNNRFPALYLIRKDHSRWANIWICNDAFRLDADERWSFDASESRLLPWYETFRRDLSCDLDIAENAIVKLLERDKLVLGNGYLPAGLTTDLEFALPQLTQPAPAALSPPTIELKAIEVRPATPAALRPVALATPPGPRKRWLRQ